MKQHIYLLCWDECDGEPRIENEDQQGDELTLPITASDNELVDFLRKQNGDEAEPDAWGKDYDDQPNHYGWRCANVTRGDSTATIEWRSDRNHLAVTTVIWF